MAKEDQRDLEQKESKKEDKGSSEQEESDNEDQSSLEKEESNREDQSGLGQNESNKENLSELGQEESNKEDQSELGQEESNKEDQSGLRQEETNKEDQSGLAQEESNKEDQSSLEQEESNKEDESSLEKEDSNKDEKQFSEKLPEEEKLDSDRQIKKFFTRPSYLEPKHPLFSSPFVRHIAVKAFGPKKPKWYTPLTSAQLYLFKDLVNYIEIGRQGLFHFDAFMEALQDFDPGITHAEVLNILDKMEKNEFEEPDFGKFLFLLAFEEQPPDIKEEEDIEKALSTHVVTARQCLILSAISYYVLIASPEEITRYYIANSRRKASILHYHMEAARLLSLTEKQMEEKQKKANQGLGLLFALTGSPYASPVPFVPRTKQPKMYREPTDRRLSRPKSALPLKKKPIQRPITPIKQSRELGTAVTYKTKDDKTFYDMHYGRIPMPMFKIRTEMRREMNKRCTVEHKDYITRKAYEAIAEYKDRLKKATVLYNNRSLDFILKKGFPTTADEKKFIEVYEKYMPLKLEDIKNFSLWVKPENYRVRHDGKPLYPDNFAFGKKIP